MLVLKLFFIGILGLLVISPVKADRRLILVAGQSNCVGKGDATLSSVVMPGTALEYNYTDDRLHPLMDPVGEEALNFQQATSGSAWPAFAQTFNRLTGDTVIIVAAARGGSSNHGKAELKGMGTWAPTGQMALFEGAVTKIKAAMKKTGLPLSAIIWVQGERDANAINSQQLSPEEYENSLCGLIQRFRSTLRESTPFFIVKTGYYRHHLQEGFDQVRATQAAVAQRMDQVHIAFEEAYTFPDRHWMVDDIHYNQQALNELGSVVAAHMIDKLQFRLRSNCQQNFCLNGIRESVLRDGVAHFIARAYAADTVRVAYIGGSITQLGERYRQQTTDLIRQRFPQTTVVEIAAGIPGTDADLGACRVASQVLRQRPDLVFVEFAVNGGFSQGVEGIIRQIKQANSCTDICLLYAATADQLQAYRQGKVLPHIQQLEALADYYRIPSVHMALYPTWMLMQDKLIAKGSQDTIATEKIVFTADAVHPLNQGGNLYATAIDRLLEKAVQQMQVPTQTNIASMSAGTNLPTALYPDNWEDARWFDPLAVVQFSGDWKPLPVKDSLEQFATWFPQVMAAEKPGASGTLQFEGDAVGLFDIGGPEVGQLRLQLDGKEISVVPDAGARYHIATKGEPVLNRFNAHCNNRYRGQFFVLMVPKGRHELVFSIASEISDKQKILGRDQQEDITSHPERYARTMIYIAKILVKGKIRYK